MKLHGKLRGPMVEGDVEALHGFGGPMRVAPGEYATLRRVLTRPFELRRLVVPSGVADPLVVVAFRQGDRSMLASSDPCPARAFTDEGPWIEVAGARSAEPITLVLQNVQGPEVDVWPFVLGWSPPQAGSTFSVPMWPEGSPESLEKHVGMAIVVPAHASLDVTTDILPPGWVARRLRGFTYGTGPERPVGTTVRLEVQRLRAVGDAATTVVLGSVAGTELDCALTEPVAPPVRYRATVMNPSGMDVPFELVLEGSAAP
jgi:hypothetical protein